MRRILPPKQPSFGAEFDIGPSRRLFFAIRPDVGATGRLTGLMERLRRDGILPGRSVEPDRLHITLHHLGDFDDQIPPSLVPTASLAAATVRMQPFGVAFDRVGGTIGPLLLRASDGAGALRLFRKTLSEALIKAGLRRHVASAFNPHMTLSYDFGDTPEQTMEPIDWTIREFVLIESLCSASTNILNEAAGHSAVNRASYNTDIRLRTINPRPTTENGLKQLSITHIWSAAPKSAQTVAW
jgi:RNA 2',3'-cyclic 3'-phosphodiesterase